MLERVRARECVVSARVVVTVEIERRTGAQAGADGAGWYSRVRSSDMAHFATIEGPHGTEERARLRAVRNAVPIGSPHCACGALQVPRDGAVALYGWTHAEDACSGISARLAAPECSGGWEAPLTREERAARPKCEVCGDIAVREILSGQGSFPVCYRHRACACGSFAVTEDGDGFHDEGEQHRFKACLLVDESGRQYVHERGAS